MVATQPVWGVVTPSAPVSAPTRADVVIVGGGFTGLWTAYWLLRGDPALDVVVLEAEHVGFGASGRNGGWVSALWPVSPDRIARDHGTGQARAMLTALRETVDSVGAVLAEEGVDADYRKGGVVLAARGAAQAVRAQRAAHHGAEWDDGTVWLPPSAARQRLGAPDILGATYNPNCARVQPRLLVEGLADAVRRRGGCIVEHARVQSISPGRVGLADGRTIRTGHVIRATEAWSSRLAPQTVVPVYSLMVATEPLSEQQWASVGLGEGEVFSDHGNLVIYGQRTADGRIAFGGRGAPYHWGSGIDAAFDHDQTVFAALRRTLVSLLPQVSGVTFTHAWGGPLGIPRDWQPSVGYDETSRVGWGGGYVGDGVAASQLAGRTLADLVLGRRTPITELPWVGHRSPRWEPEPLRWLGVNAGLRLAGLADAEERRTGRPAVSGRLLALLTGGH